MNRFFRSALFPLIVIVLLVYLASQTLMREAPKDKVIYSELQQRVQNDPLQFKEIVANPTKQELSVELKPAARRRAEVQGPYPSPESLNTSSRNCDRRTSRSTRRPSVGRRGGRS